MIVHAAERPVDPPQRTVARVGFWSAAAATACSLTYSVMQILAVAGVVQGYLSEILIFTPSLLLAPCFVTVLACLYQLASPARRIWGHLGWGFSLLYAALICIVYMTELFVVIPHGLRGEATRVSLLAFKPESVMYVLDGLGYTFMSLATLFSSQVLSGKGLESWVRGVMVWNGLLALPIFVVYVHFHPVLLAFGAMWMLTVPGSMMLLALYFRRSERQAVL